MSNEIVQNVGSEAFRELKLKFPNFSAQESESKFPIATIPYILYREMSHTLGIDDETKITSDGRDYYMRKLDPSHVTTGFSAAIGIREDMFGVLAFALWGFPPCDEDGNLNHPILEIKGGPYNTGGRSSTIREDLWPHFNDFSLTEKSVKLICLVMFRANQLSADPNCVRREYWSHDFYSSFRSASNK